MAQDIRIVRSRLRERKENVKKSGVVERVNPKLADGYELSEQLDSEPEPHTVEFNMPKIETATVAVERMMGPAGTPVEYEVYYFDDGSAHIRTGDGFEEIVDIAEIERRKRGLDVSDTHAFVTHKHDYRNVF